MPQSWHLLEREKKTKTKFKPQDCIQFYDLNSNYSCDTEKKNLQMENLKWSQVGGVAK